MVMIPDSLNSRLSRGRAGPLFGIRAAGNSLAGKTLVMLWAGQSNRVAVVTPIDGGLDTTDTDILHYLEGTDEYETCPPDMEHLNENVETNAPGSQLECGKALLTATGAARILFVGCGKGATDINGDWQPGRGAPYNDARTKWNAAWARAVAEYGAENVVAGGIHWLQGESDVLSNSFDDADLSRYTHSCMTFTLLDTIRRSWDGMDETTPIVVMSVPGGSSLTAETVSYPEVQAGKAFTDAAVPYGAFVDITSLTVSGDGLHLAPQGQRDMGALEAAANATARANNISVYTDFVPHVDNESTAFALLPSSTPNAGCRVIGDFPEFETYYLFRKSNGHLDITPDRSAYIRWNDTTGRWHLENKDFDMNIHVNLDDLTGTKGLMSDDSTGDRSFQFRVTNDDLQFWGGDDGTGTSLLMEITLPSAGEWQFNVNRTGDELTMSATPVGGGSVLNDSHTLSTDFTFWVSGDTKYVYLGRYSSAYMSDEIISASVEFLASAA